MPTAMVHFAPFSELILSNIANCFFHMSFSVVAFMHEVLITHITRDIIVLLLSLCIPYIEYLSQTLLFSFS